MIGDGSIQGRMGSTREDGSAQGGRVMAPQKEDGLHKGRILALMAPHREDGSAQGRWLRKGRMLLLF